VIGPVRVGSINGVLIFLGLSWIGLMPLVGFGLFVGIPPSSGSLALRAFVASSGALLVLVSVVVHELAHVGVARRHAVATERILVFALGGYSEIDLTGADPVASMRIALAGPSISGALGGLLLAISRVTSTAGGISETLVTVGVINVGVALFNALPALPLDGGRIVQAWAQLRGRSLHEAELVASRLAVLVGLILIVAGGAMSLGGSGASLLALPVGAMLVILSWRSTQKSADII
jgi:Zn-dependent protease